MFVFLLFGYGAAIECVQYYLSRRTFNPVDMIANGSGVVFGVILWFLFGAIFAGK